MQQGRPLWTEIDLDAVAHNLAAIRRRIGPQSQIMAVVKANAYGHGLVPVAKAALESGASCLGVACVDEGVALRQGGITAPIVVMGYLPPWEAPQVVQHYLTPTITTPESAQALAALCAQEGVRLPVHLKVDTGMGRLGVTPGEVPGLVKLLSELPPLTLEGIYTHFAVADEADKAYTLQQFRIFNEVVSQIVRQDRPLRRHVANSAAIADLPELALEMVRPGIALYGCYPSRAVGRSLDLRPALAMKSWIVRLHDLAPGEAVSYGRTWTARKPARIALIPCGYADGLPRLLSNKGSVLIRGQRAPIRGRICMDQFMVEVTHLPEVASHDEVVIIGRQGEEEIPVEEVAAQAQTISYEVLCAISARVPRFYFRSGQVVGHTTLLGEQDCPP